MNIKIEKSQEATGKGDFTIFDWFYFSTITIKILHFDAIVFSGFYCLMPCKFNTKSVKSEWFCAFF